MIILKVTSSEDFNFLKTSLVLFLRRMWLTEVKIQKTVSEDVECWMFYVQRNWGLRARTRGGFHWNIGPTVCSSAWPIAVVLAHVTRVKMGAVVTKNVSDLCSSLFRRENSMSHHKKPVLTENEDPEEDPVISKLQKTGCLEKHYAVLVNIFHSSHVTSTRFLFVLDARKHVCKHN